MSKKACEKASANLRQSLQHYVWLHKKSSETLRFPIRPKLHWCYHISQFCKYQNPKTQWTYKNEDWVGRIARIAHSSCHGTRTTHVAKGLHTKYRIMLHMRLVQALSD